MTRMIFGGALALLVARLTARVRARMGSDFMEVSARRDCQQVSGGALEPDRW
jgi:hypothetical protein